MKIEIDLDNPRFCEGCPCDTIGSDEDGICSMGYWNDSYKQMRSYNVNTKRVYKKRFQYGPEWISVILRPRECIKNHGA